MIDQQHPMSESGTAHYEKTKIEISTLGFSAGGVVRCTSSSRDMRSEGMAWHGMAK